MMGGRGGGSSIASRAATPSAAAAAPAATGMEANILSTYRALATEFDNDWVILSELRQRLGGSREDQDRALMQLVRDRKIRLIPEENQQTLRDIDRRAAISVSGEDKHFIGIV